MSNPSKKYNSTNLLSSMQNGDGRTVRARFRISTDDRSLVEAIVASERFPYRYPCDFYRHAVKFLCDHLSETEDLAGLVAECQMKQDGQLIESFRYYRLCFDELRKQVEQYLSSGEDHKARRLFQQFAGRLQNQPRSYWRDWFLELVRERWGSLFDSVHYPSSLRHELLPQRKN